MISDLWQDSRYAVRMLRKNLAFTSIAALSLAIGIGANAALFSVVDAVLLKKLPVKEPDRLVLFKALTARGFSYGGYNGDTDLDPATGMTVATSFPYQTFARLRAQDSVVSELFAFANVQVNVNVDGQADVGAAQIVSGNYFSGLGVQPFLGRAIINSDDQADASPVMVISHGYWQRRFGGDPAVLGKLIKLNDVAFTIVGVTPPEFSGTGQVGSAPDLSVPLALEPHISAGRSRMAGAGQWWLRLMGRLKPGGTAEQARGRLEAIFQQSVVEHRSARQSQPVSPGQRPLQPLEPKDYPRLAVDSGSQGEMDVRRSYARQLYLMLGVVGLVLLIACANVANLLLARATSRRAEIAVRLAMGASRWRLIRQFVTESILLSAIGGMLGILFAWWIKDGLLTVGSWGGAAMRALHPQLDLRVLGFTISLSVATGILFGLVPALHATRINLTPSLKDSERSSSGVSRSVISKSLIITQVALSLLLLIGAGLLLRTLRNLQAVDVGFNNHNLLLFGVDPNLVGYKSDRLTNLYKEMFQRIEAVPGVRSVTFSRNALFSGSSSGRDVYLSGSAGGQQRAIGEIKLHHVRENYLETMEIPLLSGRRLSSQDDAVAPRVAVVSQTFAQRVFANENAIGKRFGFSPETAAQIEIVGIARDARYASLREDINPAIYLPWLQELDAVGSMTFEVRTAADPASSVPAIRQAVKEVDRNLPLSAIRTQLEQADLSLTTERLFTRLLIFFGVIALLLAAIGLYGVMAYSVAQRTQEIGIRIALGAQQSAVLKLIVRQGMSLVIGGVGLGLLGATALTRVLSGLLFGVTAKDPVTFASVATLLAAVSLVACYIPARRATKVDPLVALRNE